MEEKYFKKSDGWLFATLKYFRKWEKINIYKIISTGNMINHAIFTLNEINDGLSRLISENYIELKNNYVKITMKGKNFIKSHQKNFELCIDEQVRYSNLFHNILLENHTTYKEYFSANEYDMAVNKYCK